MFIQGAFLNSVSLIPHTTTREPRPDDDSALIRCLDKDVYRAEKFITDHGGNGTLYSDYRTFVLSKHTHAVTTISFPEVLTIDHALLQQDRVNVFHVMLRINNNIEAEMNAVEHRYPYFFADDELLRRKKEAVGYTTRYSFDELFVTRYVNLVLSQQTGSLYEWCETLSGSGINLAINGKRQDLIIVSNRVTQSMRRQGLAGKEDEADTAMVKT